MPVLRPDSIFQEWIFTPEEELSSWVLPDLLIKQLNTLYAEMTKSLANSQIPESPSDYQDFFYAKSEVDGRMNFITMLFQKHQESLAQMTGKTAQSSGEINPLQSLEARAASFVHQDTNSQQ